MVLLPCGRCCATCNCPPGERLPTFASVSFSGLTLCATKVEDLLSLSFASCFGSGVSGEVQATGGLPNAGGPITSVSLTASGYGYAIKGRAAPQSLSITANGGSGAEFDITLAQTADECGVPEWSVASVAVKVGGDGYIDGDLLTATASGASYQIAPAIMKLSTVPIAPTISASAESQIGPNAELVVTTKQVNSAPQRWGVDTVTVSSGGEWYDDEAPVTFSPEGGSVCESAAVAKARTRRDAPPIWLDYTTGTGSGASFSTSLAKVSDPAGDFYEVSSVSILTAGSGYQNGQFVVFTTGDPRNFMPQQAKYSMAVNGSGGIVSLTKVAGGKYYRDSGVIERVEVTAAGSYYGPSTVAGSVAVVEGGRYFSEDDSLPAIVADVNVTIQQGQPSAGAGAKINAVVDSEVGSPTFGSVTALSLSDGGNGYLRWSYDTPDCGLHVLEGKTLFLKPYDESSKISNLVTASVVSCIGSGATLAANAKGGPPYSEGFPITGLTLTHGGSGYAARGRTEPGNVTVSPILDFTNPSDGYSGAQFSVSLTQRAGACDLPYWEVSSIAVLNGGTGYGDGQGVSITSGDGDTQVIAGSGVIRTNVSAPSIAPQFSTKTGSGGAVSFTVEQTSTNPARWRVENIAVASPGDGYIDSDGVTFAVTNGYEGQDAGFAQIRIVRSPPAVQVYDNGSGSGASFVPSLTKVSGFGGADEWICDSVAITSGGSGYENGDAIAIGDPDIYPADASVWILSVSGGTVTGVTRVAQGRFFKRSGPIAALIPFTAPTYVTDGVVQSVQVTSGGRFYRESNTLQPYAPPTTVVFQQTPPSNGSGAEAIATVDANPSSPSFGQITGVTLTNGGSGYLGWSYPLTCEFHGKCCGLTVTARHPDGAPPSVRLDIGSSGVDFQGAPNSQPASCKALLFTATDIFGGQATVSAIPDNSLESDYPCPKCNACGSSNEDLLPETITVTFSLSGDFPSDCISTYSGRQFVLVKDVLDPNGCADCRYYTETCVLQSPYSGFAGVKLQIIGSGLGVLASLDVGLCSTFAGFIAPLDCLQSGISFDNGNGVEVSISPGGSPSPVFHVKTPTTASVTLSFAELSATGSANPVLPCGGVQAICTQGAGTLFALFGDLNDCNGSLSFALHKSCPDRWLVALSAGGQAASTINGAPFLTREIAYAGQTLSLDMPNLSDFTSQTTLEPLHLVFHLIRFGCGGRTWNMMIPYSEWSEGDKFDWLTLVEQQGGPPAESLADPPQFNATWDTDI